MEVLEAFCDPGSFALAWADKAADLVFVDRTSPVFSLGIVPYDLAVDCASMTDLADSGQVKAFKDTLQLVSLTEVMHTNYFLQYRVDLHQQIIAVVRGVCVR